MILICLSYCRWGNAGWVDCAPCVRLAVVVMATRQAGYPQDPRRVGGHVLRVQRRLLAPYGYHVGDLDPLPWARSSSLAAKSQLRRCDEGLVSFTWVTIEYII